MESYATEQAVTVTPLPNLLREARAEISGMDWYGDELILVPQYPDRFDNHLFALEKADILAFLKGSQAEPIGFRPIPFITHQVTREIEGYQGLEAIAFVDDHVYFTIEADQDETAGYLVAAALSPGLTKVEVDASSLTRIPLQAPLYNMAYETLLVIENQLVTIYEANGAAVNPAPCAHRYDLDLNRLGEIPLPNIEYRITDATQVDEQGRFWAINRVYAGEVRLKPATPDPLSVRYGAGLKHSQLDHVERLVEFQYSSNGIMLVDTPPIQLALADVAGGRNWEAIARLDIDSTKRGFLVATDLFPETILAFVQDPTLASNR